MGKVKFTECAVAFLDILGFKDFIKAAERIDNPEFHQLCELQDVIHRQLHFTQAVGGGTRLEELSRFPKVVGLRVLHVSDSFILSAPVSNDARLGYSALAAVSMKSIQLAHQLLKMGFLIRGGAAVGSVYRTKSNIVGTGYQAAYETERCAHTPRVLFHPSAVTHFENDSHLGQRLGKWSIFAQEGPEIILDTLTAHWSYVGEDPSINVAERFDGYKQIIERNLSTLPLGRAREKWEWMTRFFNAKQRQSSNLTTVGAVEMDKFSTFRFGPLIHQPEMTFEETFGRFMAHPSRDEMPPGIDES